MTLITATLMIKRTISLAVDNRGKKTLFTYDALGNKLSETLETNLTFTSSYDEQSRSTQLKFPSVSVSYSYNGPYLHQVTKDKWAFTYTRDSEGKPIDIRYPYANVLKKWDALGRQTSTIGYHYRSQLSYDAVDNLIEYTFKDPSGTVTETYAYDELNQLIQDPYHEYALDSLSNRRKKDHFDYSLNALNQITFDGENTLLYDLNGNLLSHGDCHYNYDSQDRLTDVHIFNMHYAYTYDPFHRRLSKTVYKNGKQQEQIVYLWDGQQEIGTISKNKIKELRVLGEGNGLELGAALLYEIDGKPYFPVHDHRGSLRILYDNKGECKAHYRYTPFGEPLLTSTLSPWRFASKRLDHETGFYYFGRRHYSPTLGRFITADPQGFKDGPNLYTYLHGNPLDGFDPDGLERQGFLSRTSWGLFDLGTDLAFPCFKEATHVNNPWHRYSLMTIGGGVDLLTFLCPPAKAATIGMRGASVISRAAIKSGVNHAVQVTGQRGAQTLAKQELLQGARQTEKVASKLLNPLNNVGKEIVKYDLNAWSKAGQAIDRNYLTKAGRSLDKHGGRPGSVFPKATGNPANKNLQGQFHLDDILTDPKGICIRDFEQGGYKIYSRDGRGAFFRDDNTFRGFIERQYE